MTDARAPVLSLEGIDKAFGFNVVLRGVGFDLFAGEVLALVGENGAGKSTLMNIVSGSVPRDSGRMVLSGAPFDPRGPTDAMAKGVAIAHQETTIVPDLTVAENVFFGREPRNRLGLIRQGLMHRRCGTLMADLGFDIAPRRAGGRLSAAERHMVEIARAVLHEPSVLVLDEPTASLSARAADALVDLMGRLKARGTAIIFISHRLGEVLEAADRAVVLKDGAVTLDARRDSFDRDRLVRAMVGRTLTNVFAERPGVPGGASPILSLDRASTRSLPPISLTVRRGEILGIAGLEGQGQTPLAEALSGLRPFMSDKVELEGRPASIRSVADAVAAGIASIPDDRKTAGLALDLPIYMNMSLFAIGERSRFGFLPIAAERAFAQSARARFSIRSTDLGQPARQLSGGNQQKVVFARWLARLPKLLVLFEPTKGVDVRSKTEIYGLLGDLTAQGVAVILISSDLLELIGLSDRILTLYEGEVTAQIARPDFSEEAIMRHAAGMRADAREVARA